MTKIKHAQLDAVAQALGDLAANRMPLPITIRVHNAAKVLTRAMNDRNALKDEIIKSYLPAEIREIPGSSIEPTDPCFPELVGKLNELWDSEAEIDCGPPIDLGSLNGKAEAISVKPASLAVLDELGLMVGLPELPAAPPVLALVPPDQIPPAEATA